MKFEQIVEQAVSVGPVAPATPVNTETTTGNIDDEIKAARMANNAALLALLNRKKVLLANLNRLQNNIKQIDNQITAQKQKSQQVQQRQLQQPPQTRQPAQPGQPQLQT